MWAIQVDIVKNKYIQIRVSDEERRKLKILSSAQGMTISEYILCNSLNKEEIKMLNNRKSGKYVQKEISKLMEGKDIGIIGGEDIEHDIYSIEVKSRKKYSIEVWMKQTENNSPQGKIPLLRLHSKGKKYSDDFVIIRAKNFKSEIINDPLIYRNEMEDLCEMFNL